MTFGEFSAAISASRSAAIVRNCVAIRALRRVLAKLRHVARQPAAGDLQRRPDGPGRNHTDADMCLLKGVDQEGRK